MLILAAQHPMIQCRGTFHCFVLDLPSVVETTYTFFQPGTSSLIWPLYVGGSPSRAEKPHRTLNRERYINIFFKV